MKTTLTTLLLSALFLVGCADDSSLLTSPEAQITQQSNSPNWVKLPTDLGSGSSIETTYSSSKMINGYNGGMISLNVIIPRPGNELGDYESHIRVFVEKESFPDQENRLFTITLDPDYAFLNITPSPSTLLKHIRIDWTLEGIDVSLIDPDTFGFIYVGDNSDILETGNQTLKLYSNLNRLKVKKAEIIVPTDETPGGARYGFTR
ncbi:MAG: hypothetical protein IH852_00575 [Bacteroidetes bacterium]|nr:hypothetical protein [Bacteroidota bacterium]